MDAWPEKYVIGLTGNIATGKSVVRKMLEHLGAYGIDADVVGHRAMAVGAPGYQPVVETFGKWILDSEGHIDRSILGRLIFSNPEALVLLEEILHPLIRQGIDLLVRHSTQKVVVIEAIKLLEGGLHKYCDVVWAVHAPQEIQMTRLIQKRGMDTTAAGERIGVQGAQSEKIKAADISIKNDGSYEHTWEQVLSAWKLSFGVEHSEPTAAKKVAASRTDMSVESAGPRAASVIAEFITTASQGQRRLTRADIMEAFGEKAFVLLRQGAAVVGVMGWQVENLIVRISDVYLLPDQPFEDAIRAMVQEIESASNELQCEASILFLPPAFAQHRGAWHELGYTVREIKSLRARAWQEAAIESMPEGTILFFKRLRKDRILRPL